MKKETYRWELVSLNGSTPFIPIETNSFLPANTFQISIKFIHGHSFLSGFDTPIFDGIMDIQLKAIRKGQTELLAEQALEKFVVKVGEVLPNKIQWWNPNSGTLELSMMENCQTPVSESSHIILGRLAESLGMDPQKLNDHVNWELKGY